jgi:hypothetical protein
LVKPFLKNSSTFTFSHSNFLNINGFDLIRLNTCSTSISDEAVIKKETDKLAGAGKPREHCFGKRKKNS